MSLKSAVYPSPKRGMPHLAVTMLDGEIRIQECKSLASAKEQLVEMVHDAKATQGLLKKYQGSNAHRT